MNNNSCQTDILRADFDSIEAINKEADVFLGKIKGIDAADEEYCVIDDILAEYSFVYRGLKFSFRGSQDTVHDLSGIYIGAASAFEGVDADMAYASDDTFKSCRFILAGRQYIFSVWDDKALSEEEFESLAHEAYVVAGGR